MYDINTFWHCFQWDSQKAALNRGKYGVSFDEAATVFLDDNALVMDDPDHSIHENRLVILGLSMKGRVLVVCHCLRCEGDLIRIISARKATKGEESQYWGRNHER